MRVGHHHFSLLVFAFLFCVANPPLDAGDLLLSSKTPIDGDENAGELLARLAVLGGQVHVCASTSTFHHFPTNS